MVNTEKDKQSFQNVQFLIRKQKNNVHALKPLYTLWENKKSPTKKSNHFDHCLPN